MNFQEEQETLSLYFGEGWVSFTTIHPNLDRPFLLTASLALMGFPLPSRGRKVAFNQEEDISRKLRQKPIRKIRYNSNNSDATGRSSVRLLRPISFCCMGSTCLLWCFNSVGD